MIRSRAYGFDAREEEDGEGDLFFRTMSVMRRALESIQIARAVRRPFFVKPAWMPTTFE